ncbi:OmpA family protein [Nocardiopsis sp. HNM0947]|uniref:OmpA family protein n=1 Tax=Nocardiopsis coralli TaxID=2772213 RepID=A0ABR9PAR3_9ACTN|nr:OmpA family protein [Nocardiopsis coralli]MBE3000931.1 OmpA family protein [Nocardiopsis coralli]
MSPEDPRTARPLVVAAAVLAAATALTSCGVVRDLTGDRERPDAENAAETVEEPREEEVEADFPYTREGPIFLDTGQDVPTTFSITGLERTEEHMVLHYETTIRAPLTGNNTTLGLPPILVDPVSGATAGPLLDGSDVPYGSVPPRTDDMFPVETDATNVQRLYFPRFADDVTELTYVGSGLGAMTGIPVQDVDEEQPDPEDPNGAEMTGSPGDPVPEAGDVLEFDNRRPDGEQVEFTGGLESFVDSETTSTTRDGDKETVALKADVMFEFDEAELTDEAEEIVREAASSVANNIDPEQREITVIGHTDGKGTDDYNETLSEERAETVRDVLEEELGDDHDFELEGRGADEPVAEEGGSDDEEARARNRRVEFEYPVDTADIDGQSAERDEGVLGSSDRNVFPPADFVEEADAEVVATETYEDIELEVHPLVRDGGYVISTVSLTNTSDDPVTPDLTGDDGVLPGAPADFTDGTLGGFQLLEPDSDLARYITYFQFGEDDMGPFADEVHEMQPGNTYQLIAVFSAPPAEVTDMTLRAGPFGEIEGVPFNN